jgi:hypothetical protein
MAGTPHRGPKVAQLVVATISCNLGPLGHSDSNRARARELLGANPTAPTKGEAMNRMSSLAHASAADSGVLLEEESRAALDSALQS